MKIENRNCTICQDNYSPTSCNQKYCSKCKFKGKYLKAKPRRNSEYYERKKVWDKKWREDNKDKIKEFNQKYAKTENHKISRRNYMRKRLNNDLAFKIQKNLRKRIWDATNGIKSQRTVELVGCSIPYLLNHLESQFDDNMTWDNYGSYWHIDHIKPCCAFDLTDEAQQKKCFNFLNLQPLEAMENIMKGGAF